MGFLYQLIEGSGKCRIRFKTVHSLLCFCVIFKFDSFPFPKSSNYPWVQGLGVEGGGNNGHMVNSYSSAMCCSKKSSYTGVLRTKRDCKFLVVAGL